MRKLVCGHTHQVSGRKETTIYIHIILYYCLLHNPMYVCMCACTCKYVQYYVCMCVHACYVCLFVCTGVEGVGHSPPPAPKKAHPSITEAVHKRVSIATHVYVLTLKLSWFCAVDAGQGQGEECTSADCREAQEKTILHLLSL